MTKKFPALLLAAAFTVAAPASVLAADDRHGTSEDTDALSQGPDAMKDGDAATTTTHSRSAGATAKDAMITASVKTKLLADPDVSGMKIDVDTRNKVVSLSGTVANSTQMLRAGALAAKVDGVATVENRLLVAK